MTQTQTATAAPALLSIEGLHKSYGPVECSRVWTSR